MVNYVCVKTVPDSTKLCLIKRSKIKFPGGAYPLTPLGCHMLCTQMCTCLPIQSHFAPPRLDKNLKETLQCLSLGPCG